MKKELIELIDKAILLHLRAIANYEKMRVVANRNTASMDTRQKKKHKQELTTLCNNIKEANNGK